MKIPKQVNDLIGPLKHYYVKYRFPIITAVVVVSAFFMLKALLPKPKPKAMPARPVQVAFSENKDISTTIESFGNLTALNNVNISPQVSGQIKEVHFSEGNKVTKGMLLFTIDPAPYDAALAKAKAALAQDEADLTLKKDTLKRNQQLIVKDLISKQDFEKCQTDLTAAQAKIDLDKAGVDAAQINLDYCYIRSPIDGLTGKRQVDAGNIVSANSGVVLVNIKTIDPLYVDFTVPERELDRLRSAMSKGTLDLNIFPENGQTSFDGQLQFLDNAVDNTTGTLLLRAVVTNKDGALWAGEYVTVSLILGQAKSAVIMPYEALQYGRNGPFAFVVNADNKIELRQVKPGQKSDNDIVIESGLNSGEKVVTQGQMGLSPGAPVSPIIQEKKQ